MNDEGGSGGGWHGNCYRRRTSSLKVGHRTHLNRAILAGHGLPPPLFYFLFFWCTRTLVHTDGHRFPVIVVHIYTLAGQDGPRSLVIVKIVIPCCRPSPGDLLCKTNTSARAKVPPRLRLLLLYRVAKVVHLRRLVYQNKRHVTSFVRSISDLSPICDSFVSFRSLIASLARGSVTS